MDDNTRSENVINDSWTATIVRDNTSKKIKAVQLIAGAGARPNEMKRVQESK